MSIQNFDRFDALPVGSVCVHYRSSWNDSSGEFEFYTVWTGKELVEFTNCGYLEEYREKELGAATDEQKEAAALHYSKTRPQLKDFSSGRVILQRSRKAPNKTWLPLLRIIPSYRDSWGRWTQELAVVLVGEVEVEVSTSCIKEHEPAMIPAKAPWSM